MSTTTDPARCSRCGGAKPAGGPCPHCLLQLGLSASPAEPRDGTPGNEGRKRRAPPDPAEIAQHFPGLDILEPIGQGGMGVVYKARQKKLDRFVALKILSPDLSDDPAFAERFLREARAMARLHHRHIVAIHDFGKTGGDFGETGGLCWLLMEHVDGVNLREALKSGALTPERALAIVPQLCDALQAAHDLGVVHRDIKPENVLLDRSGAVKIADFGLAKLSGSAGDDEGKTLTGPSVAMGTAHYMAPEQLQAAHAVDHRADIFSLGVVFYEMLTGALPIGRFEPPSHRVGVDVRLDEIVLRALEQRPELRYQQAVEVKTDVQAMARVPVEPVSRVDAAAPPATQAKDEAAPPARPVVERLEPHVWRVDVGKQLRERTPPWLSAGLGFGLLLVALPRAFRIGWGYGNVGIVACIALTAVSLLLFARHVVERDPALVAEQRKRSGIARAFGTLSFLAIASSGLIAIGGGLLGAFELGTDHYVSPAPYANARVEPWSDDQGYELLRRLPESPGLAQVPELGMPEVVSYFRQHPPAAGATLLTGFLLLGLASLGGYLPRGRSRMMSRVGVALTAPIATALLLVGGYGMTQVRQLGHASSHTGVTGSTVIRGSVDSVREALVAELDARGEKVETRIVRQIVEKRTRAPVALHTLIVAQPASVFERWSLSSGEPTREEPALRIELTSAAGSSETHVLWDAGLLRIGERIGDRWRRHVEEILATVRDRVGDR